LNLANFIWPRAKVLWLVVEMDSRNIPTAFALVRQLLMRWSPVTGNICLVQIHNLQTRRCAPVTMEGTIEPAVLIEELADSRRRRFGFLLLFHATPFDHRNGDDKDKEEDNDSGSCETGK
jgi:hypothetical protein